MLNEESMETIKPVPQRRIVDKMNEYMSRRDYAGAERHLLYWLAEAELGRDLQGQLMLRNEMVGHYRKTAQREKAMESAGKALELLRELGMEDSISAGTTYVNIATACNALLRRRAMLLASTSGRWSCSRKRVRPMRTAVTWNRSFWAAFTTIWH